MQPLKKHLPSEDPFLEADPRVIRFQRRVERLGISIQILYSIYLIIISGKNGTQFTNS